MSKLSMKFDFAGCSITAVTSERDKLAALGHLLETLRESEHMLSGKPSSDESPAELTVDLDLPAIEAPSMVPSSLDQLISLLGRAMYKPECLIWIDAATLIGPTGGAIVLAGQSMAGKTTLAVSMFLAYGWKVLSEDVTLIDPANRQILPYLRPSSLRPGCPELIAAATGQQPGKLLFDRWFFDRKMYADANLSERPALALKLDGVAEGCGKSLELKPLSSAEFVRMILPISNCLRIPNGIEVLSDLFSDTRCHLISGGTVGQRMEAIVGLVDSDRQ